MEIVAFDTDDKADGSGKAKITWISKGLLNTTYNMNSTATSTGGWENCAMRQYLINTIKPLIPQNVRNAITEVTKISSVYANGTLENNGIVTTEDVWIPSGREMCIPASATSATMETSGARYADRFSPTGNDDARIKSAKPYWLRTSTYTQYFVSVPANGSNNAGSGILDKANVKKGIALGFCT